MTTIAPIKKPRKVIFEFLRTNVSAAKVCAKASAAKASTLEVPATNLQTMAPGNTHTDVHLLCLFFPLGISVAIL